MERHALEFGWLSVSSQTKINELVNGFAIFLATKYKENFFAKLFPLFQCHFDTVKNFEGQTGGSAECDWTVSRDINSTQSKP